MSRTSLLEVQTAIMAKCTGDATLMAMITGVFDFGAVVEGQTFPYITIGDAMETPLNAFGRRGYMAQHSVHIWDNSLGFDTCLRILDRLNTLLDQTKLTLSSQSNVFCLYNGCHLLNDPGIYDIRHVPVKYDIFSQE